MIKVAVIGAGQRGKDTYADYVLKGMEGVEVVGVAEPISERREYMKNHHHHLRDEFLFESWEQLLAIDKFCDAVLICTNDDMHYEPAKLALEKGYHILLEKPMTNTLEEVDKLENLAINYPNQVFMVCHVLRYTPFFSTIKRLIDEGQSERLHRFSIMRILVIIIWRIVLCVGIGVIQWKRALLF